MDAAQYAMLALRRFPERDGVLCAGRELTLLAVAVRAFLVQRASFRRLSVPHWTTVGSVPRDSTLTLRDLQDVLHVHWDMYRPVVAPTRRQTVCPVRLARSQRRAPPVQSVRPDK